MSALPGKESRSSFKAFLQWCREWASGDSASDLSCVAEAEFERIARDLRMSAAELRAVARRGPEAADLLLQRMTALDLDPTEVSQIGPETFRDLQRSCALCESKRRCARDLARDPANPAWKNYCPNNATLMALDALPWASRKEW